MIKYFLSRFGNSMMPASSACFLGLNRPYPYSDSSPSVVSLVSRHPATGIQDRGLLPSLVCLPHRIASPSPSPVGSASTVLPEFYRLCSVLQERRWHHSCHHRPWRLSPCSAETSVQTLPAKYCLASGIALLVYVVPDVSVSVLFIESAYF